jgi:hypothetical protein
VPGQIATVLDLMDDDDRVGPDMKPRTSQKCDAVKHHLQEGKASDDIAATCRKTVTLAFLTSF